MYSETNLIGLKILWFYLLQDCISVIEVTLKEIGKVTHASLKQEML